MNKNAIIALILAGSMTVAMTSCGSKEEKSKGSEKSSYNESIAMDDKTEDVEDKAEENIDETVIEPAQEILDAELTDKKIQLGTHVYQFPIPLQKLLDDGAVITNDVDLDKDIIEKYANGNGNPRAVDFILDGKKYTLQFMPLEKGTKSLKVGVAWDANDYYAENKNYDIIFAKGIRAGSTVEELINAWGEPKYGLSDENYYDLLWEDNDCTAGYKLRVDVDLESQTVKDISLRQDTTWKPKTT